jgi:hypothetical protein
MMQRCYNSRHRAYPNYGGADPPVVVYEPWHKFENLFAAVGHAPDGMSLDRYPNRCGNYEPGNVRWATRSMQNYNRRAYKHKRDNLRIYSGRMIKREARRAKLAERQEFVAVLARANGGSK